MLVPKTALGTLFRFEVTWEMFERFRHQGGAFIVASIAVHLFILIPILVTNAVFIDAERDGEQWLMDWKEEKGRKLISTNRLKTKNLVRWIPDSEA